MTPRDVIEAARNTARKSRDMYAPKLSKVLLRVGGVPGRADFQEKLKSELTIRMDLVMDCYLTGAAEMLKMLNGDIQPEEWKEDYNHEERLTELFKKYNVGVDK